MLRSLGRQIRAVRGLDHRLYARIPIDGHEEIHELRSASFENWLILNYRQRQKPVPSGGRLKSLIRTFEADAARFGSTETVWVRVADGSGRGRAGRQAEGHGRRDAPVPSSADAAAVYYLDLGDSSWRSVEIRAEGCRIVDHAPVLFRRPKGFGELPEPQWDGSLDLLKKYTNVADADFPLLVAWLTAALRPAGPYPILILSGEQGSAKSTMARVARRLIDPNSAPLRGLPASQRDFMIQAHNTWVLAYDNIRWVSKALSDVCCRTATGGGFSTRSLHSNDDETLFDIERPVIFNGIDDFARSSDLNDRCVFLHLPAIPERARQRERAYWSAFDADCPRLLGALLMAVAGGLKTLPQIDLPASPRMADFADWGEAVIRGLGGEPGSFVSRYNDNRRAACEAALDDCPVADALRRIVGSLEGPCQVTASGLLQALASDTRQSVTRMAQGPKTPRSLSCALRRIASQLRMAGIVVSFDRIDNTRMITISRT
jgi:hypothetical protein